MILRVLFIAAYLSDFGFWFLFSHLVIDAGRRVAFGIEILEL